MYIFENFFLLFELLKKKNDDNIDLLIEEDVYRSLLCNYNITLPKHDVNASIRYAFNMVYFFEGKHGYKRDLSDLYKIVGMIAESELIQKNDAIDLLELYVNTYINMAYETITKKQSPKIKDVLALYDINPVMLKDDILAEDRPKTKKRTRQ